MSNHSRLVLLSGTGGSGTSTLAAATAAAAVDEGLRVRMIDATHVPVSDEISALALSGGQALVGWVRPHAQPAQTWATLPGVRALALWHAVLAACDAPDVDVVVVDMGSLREARALVVFLDAARRTLSSLLTPALAMTRTSAGDEVTDAGAGFAAVRSLNELLVRATELVASERATMRMVTVPEEGPVSSTLRELGVLAMSGVNVDAIAVNRCARKSDGLPTQVMDRQREQLRRVESSCDGALTWKSTSTVRAVPKDRSVLGPLGGVATLRGNALVPVARDEDYGVLLPLIGEVARAARVGQFGDELVVEFDGVQRWLELPAVLRRCRAVVADRTPEGLLVSFVPDSAQWRTPDQGSAS